VTPLPPISQVYDDYQLLDSEDRYRLLIDLGRMLEPMPDALKTDATKVRGCSASVWLYPTRLDDGRLHFLADSNAAITKGIVALILAAVQDRQPDEIADLDIGRELEPFELRRELSSNRTQGVPNMIALIQDTARRLAA
jgi:cysteine desulfuration protein SufE